ncbi:MAG: ELM1/GtrOC1 family putative glycosyltransferase [Desulfobacteraceae bacterium]
MNPLHLVCVTDGRPGHEKQSLAIAQALERMTPLSVTTLGVKATQGAARLYHGFKSLISPQGFVGNEKPGTIDLVIGTGTSTHMPMVGVKRRTAARLVACMTPHPWLLPWFDLCLVPRHDRPRRHGKFLLTFGPPCLRLNTEKHDPGKGLILAGGVDVKSHHWSSTELLAQIDNIIEGSGDITWTIASSPRTPDETIEKLHQLAGGNPSIVFFSADHTPRGWIESAYESHSSVWVTADSVSMIYEALTAGCRVGVLPVAWRHPQNKFQRGIDDLKTNGMVADYEQWRATRKLPEPSKPLDEASRCAKEILLRWWPERLK